MVEVCKSVVIRRPVAEVQQQFGDVGHHERTGPHKGVRFVVVADDGTTCVYDQTTRVGPVRLRQRFELQRDDPAHQVNELVEGALAPGSITFDISAEGSDTTRVQATLRSESGGLARLAAPLVRLSAGRALTRALDEDREDLESGAYAGS